MQTGYENLSDDEFMALMQSGRLEQAERPAPPVVPVDVAQLPLLPGTAATRDSRSTSDPSVPDAIGGARAAARGIPLLGAFADEANAATAATLAPALEPILRKTGRFFPGVYDPDMEIGEAGNWQKRYDAAKSLQTYQDEKFDEENPKLSTGLQIGGGVAGTLAGLKYLAPATNAALAAEAGLAMRVGAAGLEGAGLGAASGYGMGEGAWDDPSRRGAAMTGGALGLGLGAAFPVAGALAGKGWQATGGRLIDGMRGRQPLQTNAPDVAERIAEVLRRGEAPEGVLPPASSPGAARVTEAMAGPPPPSRPPPPSGPPPGGASYSGPNPGVGSPGPMSGAQRSTAEAQMGIAAAPSVSARASEVDDAYMRIARALTRQGMDPDEAIGTAMRIGPFGTLADTGIPAQDLLRAAVNRPGRAAQIVNDNLGPRQRGVFNDVTGEYDIRPSSMRLADQAAEGMGLSGREYLQEMDGLIASRKAASDPAYEKLRAGAPVSADALADFAASPLFKKAYDRAKSISQTEFVRGPDGSEAIMPLPDDIPGVLDWRTLDLMKQGLDDLVWSAKAPAKDGIGKNEIGVIKGYLSRFVDRLDSLNSDYKPARDAFAGPTAMMEALEAGRAALREDVPAMTANLAKLSDSEKQMYRLGALKELENKLGNANVTFDAASQAGFLKPNQLKRFRELFPTPEAFTSFYRAMAAEKQMFGANSAATGNSTSVRQALHAAEPGDPQMEGAGEIATSAATGNIGGLFSGIRRLGMESPISESVSETIASLLTTNDPAALRRATERLYAARAATTVQDSVRRTMGAGGGQAGGQAAGRRPEN